MNRLVIFICAGLLSAGCAGYENTTRDAAVGAGLCAAAGAVIGNNVGSGDAETGAFIGGAVGAAAGAASGCRKDGRCPWSRANDAHSQLRYDREQDRRWYRNSATGCTYWRDGEPRSCEGARR